jgi:hypothetical protein
MEAAGATGPMLIGQRVLNPQGTLDYFVENTFDCCDADASIPLSLRAKRSNPGQMTCDRPTGIASLGSQ